MKMQTITMMFRSLALCALSLSKAEAYDTENAPYLQQSIDSLSGTLSGQHYLSPSNGINCLIPADIFEDQENNALRDRSGPTHESLSLHTQEASPLGEELFLIRNISRTRLGHGTLAQVDPESSTDEKIQNIIDLIKTQFLEEGLVLNQEQVKSEALTVDGRPARFVIAAVSLSENDHQLYGHLVTLAGNDVVIVDYMPLLVPVEKTKESAEDVEDGLLTLARSCRFSASVVSSPEEAMFVGGIDGGVYFLGVRGQS